ncbi:MAG: hypothetical protein WEA61_03325 [Anaerolineales bacterium]
MGKQKEPEKKVTNEKPISLAGIEFKKLLGAFLQVKPEAKKGAKPVKK